MDYWVLKYNLILTLGRKHDFHEFDFPGNKVSLALAHCFMPLKLLSNSGFLRPCCATCAEATPVPCGGSCGNRGARTMKPMRCISYVAQRL